MKKISVITTSRSDYGILKNLIKKINDDSKLELDLIVSGTHVLHEYGNTIDYIIQDGFKVNKVIDYLYLDNTSLSNAKSCGIAFEKFSDYFSISNPDIIILEGDRYELIPICGAALILGIRICHISGGEVTEGAIDDAVRNAVTKMSNIHFPACANYRKRIIQMGEQPNMVFNYGDLGVEQVFLTKTMTKEECLKKYNLKKDYYMVVFHPVTYEGNCRNQINTIISALEKEIHLNNDLVFIKSNADADSSIINEELKNYCDIKGYCLFDSLKYEEYLGLLKYSSGIIGNSSSGIVEAPCFCVPTINIGNRQRGRLFAKSIYQCDCSIESICSAFNELNKFDKSTFDINDNPYIHMETTKLIIDEIKRYLNSSKSSSKRFYDVDFKEV